MKKKTLFDYINAISSKNKIKYDKKIANSYILSLWLAHDDSLLFNVNKINEYLFSLPDELIYQYYMKSVPKQKRYIKWVKKDVEDKKYKKQVEQLMVKYCISEREARLTLK